MPNTYTLADLMRNRGRGDGNGQGSLSALQHYASFASQPALQPQAMPDDEPLPSEWWKRVPPHERDWWMRRLNAMPFADPNRFRDDNALMPNAPGALGDRIPAYDQDIVRDYFEQQGNRWDMLGGRPPR